MDAARKEKYWQRRKRKRREGRRNENRFQQAGGEQKVGKVMDGRAKAEQVNGSREGKAMRQGKKEKFS